MKNIVTTYYPGRAEVGEVVGDCKSCGKKVSVNYDDFEELGIQE